MLCRTTAEKGDGGTVVLVPQRVEGMGFGGASGGERRRVHHYARHSDR
jgi:hypothetical protein